MKNASKHYAGSFSPIPFISHISLLILMPSINIFLNLLFFVELFIQKMIDNQLRNRMIREKSIQNSLFTVLYQINSSQSSSEILSLVIIALYMVQLLFSFFVSTNPTSIISQSVTSSSLLALLVASLSGVVIIEFVVALIYRVQIQLYLQLMLFRYALFPIALLLLAQQLQTASLLALPLTITLLALITALAFSINFIIHSHASQSVFRQFQKSSSRFLMTDCLFMLIKVVKSFTYLQMVLLAILTIHFMVRFRLKNYYFSCKRQQFQYFSLIVKEFLIGIILVQNLLSVRVGSVLLLVFCVPLLLFAFIYQATRQRSATLDRHVFTAKAGITSFFEFINAMSLELLKFKSNQNSDFQHSLLLVFIAVHKSQCNNSSCLLLQKSTDQEIRNCNSLNNLKILKHKIIKKLEFLFELYEQSHGDNPKLKLLLISFYISHLPNKLKLTNLSASIKNMRISWGERLVFFGLNQKIEKIEIVEELIDITKTQDDFTEFKKLMSNAVSCFQEFWGRVLQEKVDVNQLMAISEKLFPLKKSIQQAWKKHLNEQTFSSWSILKTYTYYRRSIMHDYTNSVILQGYCKIIEQRLKAKHEMSYINSETEQAVIAISLTESSLGNIASLNNQTCKLFNFASKSEMLDLRVNDIMPSVYSVVHDNILSSFLKNRFKDINQDQRFVFGKNKNHFIFPFLLQLRKLSWNVNDELIFIAHLEPAKIRTSPIYCITDLQGDIQDFTSTFAWLFMKKIKNNSEIKKKNIQEMIPSFFEAIENIDSQYGKKVKFIEKSYSQKNGQQIEISFSASQVFIKSQKVGYLINGQNSYPLKSINKQTTISALLSNFYHENNIYTNSYNPSKQCFELPNRTEMTKIKQTREFTIPFIKTSDLEGILRYDQQVVKYDENIKTFRLFRGRLEHVVEEESFNSEEDIFELKQLSVIKKIAKMKEQMSVNQHSKTGDYFKISVIIINTLFLILMVVIISSAARFQALESEELQEIQYKLNIRQLFPEYLIYTFYPHADTSDRLLDLRNDLKLNLVHSNIGQIQKQQIMRIVFSSQIAQSLSLDSSILTFNLQSISNYQAIIALWYLTAAGSFLYIVCLVAIYCLFKFKISKIYTIFVSINQNKLIQIKAEAQKLLEFLSIHNMEYNVSPLPDFKKEDLEEAEFHRMKKMKNDYTIQDLASLSQLILPALIILLYTIFCCISIQANFSSYNNYLQAWIQSAELLPETSIELMQDVINKNNLGSVHLPTQFYSIEQEYEYIIVSRHFSSNQLLPLLKGDPCISQYLYQSIAINTSRLCANSSVPLDYSFSNLINYLSSVLQSSNTSASIDWHRLISIEYDYFKPLLNHISILLKAQVGDMRLNCRHLLIIFGIVYICLVALVGVYIICFPLNKIYEKIIFTTDLIKILPSQKQAEPEHALAAMTTEAMEPY